MTIMLEEIVSEDASLCPLNSKLVKQEMFGVVLARRNLRLGLGEWNYHAVS